MVKQQILSILSRPYLSTILSYPNHLTKVLLSNDRPVPISIALRSFLSHAALRRPVRRLCCPCWPVMAPLSIWTGSCRANRPAVPVAGNGFWVAANKSATIRSDNLMNGQIRIHIKLIRKNPHPTAHPTTHTSISDCIYPRIWSSSLRDC